MSRLLDLYSLAAPLLLKGVIITVQISVCALLMGLFVGALLGVCNSNQMRRVGWGWAIDSYVATIRGTPVFVQVLIVYFGIPALVSCDMSPLQAGVFTLGINSAAYLSEVVRGAVNAIPKGQWEACQTLGYRRWQALLHVILPQAASTGVPAIVNEMISLVKESSILMVIGVPELTKVSKDIVAYQLRPVEIYLLCAGIYLAMTTSLQLVGRAIERSKQWVY